MGKIIILIGAPGAGKGTQARLLEERRGLPQISTGDLFRAIAKSDSPLALEVRSIQEAGALISDELVIRVVEDRTGQTDCANGYVLDGFPRTTVQATKLEVLAREQDKKIQAIEVNVPFDQLTKRLTGRRSCPVCGEIYNVYYKAPKSDNVCDVHPDAQLTHRADDREDTIKSRLEAFEKQTAPLLDYYAASHRLARVDGTAEPEAIYSAIEAILVESVGAEG
jgi:adenylate kinase